MEIRLKVGDKVLLKSEIGEAVKNYCTVSNLNANRTNEVQITWFDRQNSKFQKAEIPFECLEIVK